MKIGVESSALARRKTGVGYYTFHLLKATAKLLPQDQFCLTYFTGEPHRPDLSEPNVKAWPIKFPLKIFKLFEYYSAGLIYDRLAKLKADLFLFPNYMHYRLRDCPRSIVFVYDLSFIKSPEYFPGRFRRYLARKTPVYINRAETVVTLAEATKQAIVEQYGTNPAKVHVINPGLDHQLYRPAKPEVIDQVKKKLRISGDYLLYLGTIEPRKNIEGIIQGYLNLPSDVRDRYQLVLAGGKGWLDQAIDDLIKQVPGGRLVRTGYVSDEDKPALYSGATLFLYPSHYEGWGMQILEAMACGTPVITADNSSLPEAGGRAASFIKADSAGQLTGEIKRLLSDEAGRLAMAQAGLEHAAKFNWEKSAQLLATLIKPSDPNNPQPPDQPRPFV